MNRYFVERESYSIVAEIVVWVSRGRLHSVLYVVSRGWGISESRQNLSACRHHFLLPLHTEAIPILECNMVDLDYQEKIMNALESNCK